MVILNKPVIFPVYEESVKAMHFVLSHDTNDRFCVLIDITVLMRLYEKLYIGFLYVPTNFPVRTKNSIFGILSASDGYMI